MLWTSYVIWPITFSWKLQKHYEIERTLSSRGLSFTTVLRYMLCYSGICNRFINLHLFECLFCWNVLAVTLVHVMSDVRLLCHSCRCAVWFALNLSCSISVWVTHCLTYSDNLLCGFQKTINQPTEKMSSCRKQLYLILMISHSQLEFPLYVIFFVNVSYWTRHT